jgi:hypothetical protein
MSNENVVETTLWLVIQEGGSSGEHYPTLYTNRDDAKADEYGHREATYRSTHPIPVKAEMRDGQAWIAEPDLIELVKAVREAEYR